MRVEKKIFRLVDVLAMYGVSKATIYRWVAQGRFPRPVKIGERAVGWTDPSLKEFDKSFMSAEV